LTLLVADSVEDGPFSVEATAVSEAAALEEFSVGQRKATVLFHLPHHRVGGLDQAFVPVRVLLHQCTNFSCVKLMIVVAVAFVCQTLPELVLVDGAGAGRNKQEEKAECSHGFFEARS